MGGLRGAVAAAAKLRVDSGPFVYIIPVLQQVHDIL